MTIMHLNLHDDLKNRIAARAAESGFQSAEAYVEALLKADVEQDLVDTKLEELLMDCLQGGPGIPLTGAYIEQFNEQVAQRRRSRGIVS